MRAEMRLEVVKGLEETRDRTLKYFHMGESELAKTYGPGKWSARFVLLHLADSETVFYERLGRVISEPKGVIWAYDQEAWARGLDYAVVPTELARRRYEATRASIIHLATVHYEKDGAREFVHSEMGVRTLKDEFDKVVWHNEKHLEQIGKALAG